MSCSKIYAQIHFCSLSLACTHMAAYWLHDKVLACATALNGWETKSREIQEAQVTATAEWKLCIRIVAGGVRHQHLPRSPTLSWNGSLVTWRSIWAQTNVGWNDSCPNCQWWRLSFWDLSWLNLTYLWTFLYKNKLQNLCMHNVLSKCSPVPRPFHHP